jgi:hypothetical protein
MKLQEVITVLENRIRTLTDAKVAAFNAGDLQRIVELEADLLTTQISINQIKNSNPST